MMKMMVISMVLVVVAVILFAYSYAIKTKSADEKNTKMAKNMKIASAVLGAVGLVGLAMHHKKSGAAGSTKYYYF